MTKTDRMQELFRLLVDKVSLAEDKHTHAHKLINGLSDDSPDETPDDPFLNTNDSELIEKAFAGDAGARAEYKRRQVEK